MWDNFEPVVQQYLKSESESLGNKQRKLNLGIFIKNKDNFIYNNYSTTCNNKSLSSKSLSNNKLICNNKQELVSVGEERRVGHGSTRSIFINKDKYSPIVDGVFWKTTGIALVGKNGSLIHVTTRVKCLATGTHVTIQDRVPYSSKPQTCFNMYMDGTIITSVISDQFITRQWYNDIIEYLCTIDYCHFPSFTSIDLSETPRRSLKIQNAGGSSNISEALSIQYMHYLLGVKEFVPECEVDYWIEYKMCDYIMKYQDANIGVSVTRAMTYPFDKEFTYDHAMCLLNKKLNGLIIARNAVNPRHRFYKSILHVWCMNQIAAQNIEKAYMTFHQNDNKKVYSTIYVICTVSKNQYIFTNRGGTPPIAPRLV